MSGDLRAMVEAVVAARASDDEARAIKALADAGFVSRQYAPILDAVLTAARWASSNARAA